MFALYKSRKEKNMKKLIPLLLALIMIVSALAACNNTPAATSGQETPKPNASQNNQTNASTPAETDPDDLLPDEEKLNIDLEGLDYGNREFYIYHWDTDPAGWSADTAEFEPAENAVEGDPINNALYLRNLYVEEGLGIKLNFHAETGHDTHQDAFVTKLKTRLNDPETPVDLIGAYSRCAPHILVAGLAVDLEAYAEDLDMSKTWWPSLVREEHEIRGRVFYVSGDASPGVLTQMESLFVNKDLLKSFGYDYDKFATDVLNGKWTHDDLIEMTKDRYQDIDGIAGKSNGDFFGITGENVCVGDAMWTAYGYRLLDKSSDEDQIYELSDDLLGENAANFVRKMTDWWATNDAHLQYEFAADVMNYQERGEHFGASKALFTTMRVGSFDSASMDIDYTILPFPKGNDSQERYYTCVRDPYTQYSICAMSLDKDLVAQALQAMGYYGYKHTTPAIFEVTFKGKVAKDDYAIKMFDLIRESITFDVGRTFDRITGTMLPNLVSRAWCYGQSWASAFSATKRKVYTTYIENTNKEILDMLEFLE